MMNHLIMLTLAWQLTQQGWLQGGESDCDDGSKQSAAVKPGNSIRLQANLTDQQIQTALKVSHWWWKFGACYMSST